MNQIKMHTQLHQDILNVLKAVYKGAELCLFKGGLVTRIFHGQVLVARFS